MTYFSSKYTESAIYEMFQRFEQHNPNPIGELNYSNNFTLLVAVLLSAQTTDIAVNKSTTKLFKLADSAEKMAKLPLEIIENHIKSIGLWRNKAKNVKLLAQFLIEKHNGQVPQNFEQLINLPGVGRKTANVVLNVAFNEPTLAIDTHIFRLSNRLKIAIGKTPLEVEQKLLKIIPKNYLQRSHLWLILHGRYICKARQPLCEICFLKDICLADCNPYNGKTTALNTNHPSSALE